MSRRRSGLTLLEVIISAAIVSLLALVLMAANVPVSRAASEAGVAFDLDRAAGRFLTEVRREARQSGYNGVDFQMSVPGPSTLGPFRRRTAFGTTIDDMTPTNSCWTQEITYHLVASTLGDYADGVPRYVLKRDDGVSVDVVDDVQTLAFELVLAADADPDPLVPFDSKEKVALKVNLTLRRENPGWRGTGDGQFITRTYSEDIELLNKLPKVP